MEKITKISKIFNDDKELNSVTIEGEVIIVDSFQTRTGSYLVKAVVYDGTSSIHFSMFSNEESDLKEGEFVRVTGRLIRDSYNNDELTVKPNQNGVLKIEKEEEVIYDDGMGDKHRVSLQNFGFMTAKRGAVPVSKFFKKAKKLGHKALAITDLGVVHSFPEISKVASETGIKPIYGMTALSVQDNVMVYYEDDRLLTEDIVVFDVETTGLSARYNDVIEIGAAKISGGKIVDTFQTFVKTDQEISEFIQNLTNITPEIIKEEGVDKEVAIKKFDDFVGDSMLAAHNAFFDLHMLEELYVKSGLDIPKRPLIDTLKVSRKVNEEMRFHSLGRLARSYKVDLRNAHRADDDSKATAEILIQMIKQLEEDDVKTTKELQEYKTHLDYSMEFPREITIWVKNQKGLKNLYEIVSKSHTKTMSALGDVNGSNRPVVSWELINEYREGLIIGSGGYNGHLFDYGVNKPDRIIIEEIEKYDVIQIEPSDVATHLVVDDDAKIDKLEYLEKAWQNIYNIAKEKGKFIVATDGAHYTDKEEAITHNILIYSQLPASRSHDVRRAKMEYPMGPAYMRTTKEMYESFPYLSPEEKERVIITNPNLLASRVEEVQPLPVNKETRAPILYTPKIDGIEDKFRELAFTNARKMYGEELPKIVYDRLTKEVDSIIDNGFSVIYMISRDLVKKSLEDGYLVGSRGSVGSSLAATMTEITEVNPMPPHYVCKECKWNIFLDGSEELLSGFDLPDSFSELLNQQKYSKESIDLFVKTFSEKFSTTDSERVKKSMENHDGTCPNCKEKSLEKDGHNIPFETFLGFTGDKIPDIDLNFSDVYQNRAHKFTQDLFGESNVFRAGTITTVASRTAFAFVMNYFKNHNVKVSNAEIQRIARTIEGSRDSTGQHPGGMLVVPSDMEMTDICPYQYPSNNLEAEFMISHFNFESVEDNILKLDILGHQAPTVLRYLQDYTGIDPREVPSSDPDVLGLFNDTEKSIGVNPEDYFAKTGTLGMPEMGTRVVQDVIDETRPQSFGDLITLSGLTHGTDVYYNNAQKLIQEGTASIGEVIGTRDDIMRYLITKGLEESMAFDIMESVRRGRGLTEEWEEEMRRNAVPDWYIWSCNQIKYMFPRSHAAAYVLDATRIGYYKVNYPLEYYAAVFTARYRNESILELTGSAEVTRNKIIEIDEEIRHLENIGEVNAAGLKKRTRAALNIALEAKLRGFNFDDIKIYESHKTHFLINEEKKTLIPPLSTIPGMGPVVTERLYQARFDGVFRGLKDLRERTGVTKSHIDILRSLKCLDNIEEVRPRLY